MKEKRSRPFRTLLAVSLIAAFVFTALPLGSAFAAPAGPGGDDTQGQEWEAKIRNLQGQMAFFNNLRTQPGRIGNNINNNNNDADQQARYLDRYRAAMRAAQAIMVNGGATISGNEGNNGIGKYYLKNPEKLLAMYLHQMRQLREKMGSGVVSDANNGGDTGTGTGTGTNTSQLNSSIRQFKPDDKKSPGQASRGFWFRQSVSEQRRRCWPEDPWVPARP